MNIISSGTNPIDKLVRGYEKDCITTIYGPGGSGKTNLCILAAIKVARQGKKVIYIDTDGSFSIARFSQINDSKEILEKIVFYKPTSFKEQKEAVVKIKNNINDQIGLIILDSIAMLYRLKIGQTKEIYETNRDLGLQIGYLIEISRKNNIPILITNQVYSSFEEKEKVNMVGGDLLKYGSKCLIELKKLHSNKRRAILRKHRSLPEKKEVLFKIINSGIEEFKIDGI